MLPNRDECVRIEALLQGSLHRRKKDYEISKKRFDQVVENTRDLEPENPDGAISVRHAAKDYNQALVDYRDALMDLNQFLLHGRVPDYLKD